MLFSSCHKDHQVVHFASVEDSLHIILPLYAFPTDDEGKIWNAVAQAGYKVPITVIWGMSDTSDAAVYRNYLAELARAPYITLVAYVATGSGQRPAKEVKDKIKYYAENFDIQGIFLDEVNHEPEFDDYYKQRIITQAVENNIGNVFVTNRGYDKLPGYWDKEVELVQEINTR